jgi:hypothetical protein
MNSTTIHTHRAHPILETADLLGSPCFTAYRPDGTVLGQASSLASIRRQINRSIPAPSIAQGHLPFSDGAQLGPLFQ